MKICLDPGHGGRDPGAMAKPLVEKDLNLTLMNYIYSTLHLKGHDILFTRTKDVYVPNNKRVTLANEWGANLFISIHHNAYRHPTANGFEVLYHSAGIGYAKAVCKGVTASWPIRNRGAKPRRLLTVLRRTEMPAILIEAGFITSVIDRRKTLLNKVDRQAFYSLLADVVVEAIN